MVYGSADIADSLKHDLTLGAVRYQPLELILTLG